LPAEKHIPERTCVACGKVRPQRDMVRLVCTAEHKVEVDTKGKQQGRGAYICRLSECWQSGLKSNKLERALRTSLLPEYREKLAQDLKESCIGQRK
jgi:predicted RNA-binding protein YlxR (DUF448 family)